MLTLRKSNERGHADHGWLKSFHSFSFADYHDPRHMGWGNLRVINEDWIAPGTGFGRHGHRDMEIVSYVVAGALVHQDSMGNTEVIPAGDVQRMSAGTGVMHSEFNHAQEHTHLLQIWMLPTRSGFKPGYEQKAFGPAGKRGRLQLVASPDGGQGSVSMNADARLYACLLDGTEQAALALDITRKGYLHVVRGSVRANGQALSAGDALLMEHEAVLRLEQGSDAEVLFFDLAP